MKISVKINLHSKTIFLALAWLSFTPGALAANNINVQTLTPSANLDYSLTESAKPLGEEDSDLVGLLPKPVFFFGATYNYLNDPLVELDYLKENRLNLLVNHI